MYKGFNDTLATWGTNRVTNQMCGQAWQQTFSEIGKFYSSSEQLPAIQIATWNDYEEGTAIEPGIDNCIYLAPSQSGTKISWSVNGGDESTVDHYTVFISSDGTNLAKLADVPRGTHTHDLGDAVDALERLVERARDLFLEVIEVHIVEQLAGGGSADVDQLTEQAVEFAEGLLEEAQVVADVLRRRVDLRARCQRQAGRWTRASAPRAGCPRAGRALRASAWSIEMSAVRQPSQPASTSEES